MLPLCGQALYRFSLAASKYSVPACPDQALEVEQAEAEAKHRLYTLLFERTRYVWALTTRCACCSHVIV